MSKFEFEQISQHDRYRWITYVISMRCIVTSDIFHKWSIFKVKKKQKEK